MKKYLFFLLLTCIAIGGCHQEVLDVARDEELTQTSESEFLVFSNRDDVGRACNGELLNDLKGTPVEGYAVRSLNRDTFRSSQNEIMDRLVPDEAFRNLLNSRGEVQVGDTVYCITKEGTFYAHRKDLEALRYQAAHYVAKDSLAMTESIGNVSLYKTFHGVSFDDQDVVTPEGDGTDEELFRSNKPRLFDLDFSTFPLERASRKTWAGKILQSLGIRKSLISVFSSDKNRRFNCAVFDYNYLIRSSIGVTAKIQKKMWHSGWGKLKYLDAEDVIIGCRYAIIKMDYPKGMENIDSWIDNAPRLNKGSEQDAYVKSLPYPEWFKNRLINVTLPIVSKEINITLKDAIQFASERIKGMMRATAYHTLSRDHGMNYLSLHSNEELDREIKKLKMEDFVPVTVPIYTKEGIYLLIKNAYAANRTNDAETTIRFTDAWLSFHIGYTTGTDRFGASLKNFKPTYDVSVNMNTLTPEINSVGISNANFALKASAPKEGDGELIEGEFVAAGHHRGSWVGYRLYW